MDNVVVSIMLILCMATLSPLIVTDQLFVWDLPNNNENAVLSGIAFDEYVVQWERSYGRLPMWSARYEGPQPVGDADNDGENELLIGGRDPFMRVMKWDHQQMTYYEQQKIIDPVPRIGYTLLGFGSATGFSIADVDNDGSNNTVGYNLCHGNGSGDAGCSTSSDPDFYVETSDSANAISSGTTSTLTIGTTAWTANAYQYMGLKVSGGSCSATTNTTKWYGITKNTTDTLHVAPNFDAAPDNNCSYEITICVSI